MKVNESAETEPQVTEQSEVTAASAVSWISWWFSRPVSVDAMVELEEALEEDGALSAAIPLEMAVSIQANGLRKTALTGAVLWFEAGRAYERSLWRQPSEVKR